VFEKFVLVGDVLRKLGNFSSLMAILAGLGQSSTARLTHTKNALSADCKKILADLENLMSPQKSFSNYRNALRACKPPAVPYLGVYLQDLTFIEDGNPEVKRERERFGCLLLKKTSRLCLLRAQTDSRWLTLSGLQWFMVC
jgi:son of sevenless-like protein